LTLESPEALQNWGERYAQETLKSGDLILVSGEMGAGKTTLAQGIACGLGIKETVTSPTFNKLNIYMGHWTFYHLDLYNVASHDELERLGIYEILEPTDGVCLVEWWENLSPISLPPHRRIELEILESGRSLRAIDIA
jgi:tRNA threonylcarbamoyladenosine biosynthesis protein TsaE